MVSVWVWIVWIGAVLYAVGACAVMIGLGRIRSGNAPGRPTVSVIVAARNEARSIGGCLAALHAQDYDPGRYEVIVADDRSTDGTSGVVRSYAESWDRLRLVRIERTPAHYSPKKHALATAIGSAEGEIILQTDADCEVPPAWISGMVRGFEPGVGFVAGIAPYRHGPGMLNSFVRHEYLMNAALLSAGIALGGGVHASGRNLGFRRDLFLRIGGYGDSIRVRSGDDTLLLHRFVRSGLARAAVMPDPSTHVFTGPPTGFGLLVRQRMRHLSTGRFFDVQSLTAGALVSGFHLALVLAFVGMPFSGSARAAFFGGFSLKCAVDAFAAWMVRKRLGLDVDRRSFILNELLLTAYWAFLPAAAAFVRVGWKEAGEKGEPGKVEKNIESNSAG